MNQSPKNNKSQPKSQPQNQNKPAADQKEDLEQVKIMAALAYLGILFFLPLVTYPNSKFGKFHANQGLILFLFALIGYTIAFVTSFILIGLLIYPIVFVAAVIFFIMGLLNALNKEEKRLPIIGKYDLIK